MSHHVAASATSTVFEEKQRNCGGNTVNNRIRCRRQTQTNKDTEADWLV